MSPDRSPPRRGRGRDLDDGDDAAHDPPPPSLRREHRDPDEERKHGRGRATRDKSRDHGRRRRSMSPTDSPPRRTSRSRERHRGHRREDGRGADETRSRRKRRSRSRSRSRDKGKGTGGEGRTREREHRRPRSRDDHHRHSRRDGPSDRKRRRSRSHDDSNNDEKQIVRRNGPLPSQADSFAVNQGEEPPKPKEQPSFAASGALAAASNSVAQADGSTIVLKYHEPPEARKPPPKDQWKLFVFKGDQILDTVPLSQRSCWLVGRDPAVVDMMAEHPSISKQHAVIQFRYLEKRNEYGDKIGRVKPYLIDLESANGTMLNSKKVPDSRYLELKEKDLVQFGQSTREYVLMLAPKD